MIKEIKYTDVKLSWNARNAGITAEKLNQHRDQALQDSRAMFSQALV